VVDALAVVAVDETLEVAAALVALEEEDVGLELLAVPGRHWE
jgi:hypothetical protein